MEKQILKKLDNIRNNLLHSIDALSDKDYPQEKIEAVKAYRNKVLEQLSEYRAILVPLFNKKDNKKENKKD